MGGLGSGNWRRKDTRKLVTGAFRLDVGNIAAELRRASETGQAQGKAFPLAPFGAGLLGVLAEPDSVRLIFDMADGVACVQVRVEKRACRFGGFRFWFACPLCDRLCQSLFREGDSFLCRVCCGLAYPVQNERKAASLSRAFIKARGRLVRDGVDDERIYPARPKGMHKANYEALAARQLALLERKVNAEVDWVGRVIGRRVKIMQRNIAPQR